MAASASLADHVVFTTSLVEFGGGTVVPVAARIARDAGSGGPLGK